MILLFPNLDTLRLALSSSIVPPEVTLAPAVVSFDDQGKIYLESAASLSRTVTKNLDRIGVKGSKRHASDSLKEISCWPQALPLSRENGTPQISNQSPVLFELSEADDLPVLATEMLRLGNDRQGFRWFANPGDPDSRSVLLRVIGPPYFTLLRALDTSAAGTKGKIRAYLERAPRVWVEVGYSHPLASQLRVAERQMLLIHSPREWVYLDDTPFQDVYDIMQFKLPSNQIGWTEAKSPKKFAVPLKLTAGNAADVAELWVLRDNAIEQLDALVRDSDERLTQRLMFAVATDANGQRAVILRTRPSKLAPPALPLENTVGFKPFWKLPNLFVPVGRRLHPTLRRDAVRKLLADDPDQVVWLYPDDKTGYTPESVPDGAFRSLEDWVDYIIESNQKPLSAWIESTRFDFDHFICKETSASKSKPDDDNKGGGPRPRDEDDIRGTRLTGLSSRATAKSKPVDKASGSTNYLPLPEEVKKPSEWRIRREALEKQFFDVEGGLDAPERQALWPALAAANAGESQEGQRIEAAICWLNAMWETDPIPAAWLGAWVRNEFPTAGSSIRAEEFDKRLAQATPGKEEARAIVAGFLWLAAQNPLPSWLLSRLPAVQSFLEKHEDTLPIRATWLAAYRLSQLSGSDILGLARVRDRLLNRLLTEGLSAEKDLPGFLRYAGNKDSERMRVVRDKAFELHAAIRKWSESIPQNLPYIDLQFAFALAKLQETTAAKKLIEDARKVMEVPIPTVRNQQDEARHAAAIVSNYLFKAFLFRIDQVLLGKRHNGPLSPELVAEFEAIHKQCSEQEKGSLKMLPVYAISRMKEQSHILEPHEKLEPYSEWTKNQDPLRKELADLHALRESNRLAERVRKLYREGIANRAIEEVRFVLLLETIPLAPRVGESFTVELIQLVPEALASWPPVGAAPNHKTIEQQGELLQRALSQAGNYDRRDLVKKLIDEFSDLAHGKKEEERFRLINAVGGSSLCVMKRLGMNDEIDRFFTKLHNELLRGASIAELKKKHASKPDSWSSVLQTLLNLAGGWLTFGLKDRAEPILIEARNELLNPQSMKYPPKDYPPLAQAYVCALGQGPSESGMARITELFRKMDDKKLANTWTTAPFYSRYHLNLTEEVIRAIVSDEFALGPGGRKWLDDDEYLVRRRIHADMKRERDKSGL